MKERIRKSGALLLSALLLFSTLSFTVDMHFCGETLVDLGVFHKAEGCGMAMDGAMADAPGCCSDETVSILGQDELNPGPAAFVVHLPSPLIQSGFQVFSPLLVQDPWEAFIPFPEYSPPRLVFDIPLRDQRMLI